MTPPVPGTEKIAARTLDILYRNDVNVEKISKNILPPSHASSEDIKLLINLLNPKYIVPVIGEYRHQYALRNVCEQLGYNLEDVIMLDNGQVLELQNKKIVSTKKSIQSGDYLVDGILENDVSDVVLRDREMLAEDGVLLVIANVDARNRKIVSGIEVVSRGFIYMKENEDLIDEVKDIVNQVSQKVFTHKYIDWRVYKDLLKDDLSKYLYRSTKRKPIVIPVLIDTQIK
jgi:ribonuclease J